MGRALLPNDDTYAAMQFVNLTDKCHKLDCGLFLGIAEPGIVLGPDADTVDPRTTADEVNGPVLARQQPATGCGNVVGQSVMENPGQQSVARLEGSQRPEVANRHEPTLSVADSGRGVPAEPALFTCDRTEPIPTCADHSLFSSHGDSSADLSAASADRVFAVSSVDAATAVTSKYPHVEPVIASLPDDLSADERDRAIRLIADNSDVFSKHEFDFGRTDLLTHKIDTGNHRPIAQPMRRHPRAYLDLIDQTVDKMIEAGVVEPAASPWSFNIVLVSRPGNPVARVTID